MQLAADQITVGYGPCPVLSDFSLGLDRGDFVAVVGPNGSGKSTLIKALSRSLRPTAGRVLLGGHDIHRLGPAAVAKEMAVVAQATLVDFDFTVEEIVMMGRTPHLKRLRGETAHDRQVVRQAMRDTDTLGLADRLITGLSGGERQRVLVARALAQQPSILLLDEPTAHLDIRHQVELLDLVRGLNRERGLTVLAVLHDLNLASQYASRMLMLRQGQRFAEGPPATVVTEETVQAVYGSRVLVMRHPEEGSPHIVLLSAK